MNSYDTNIKNLTCSCLDWQTKRAEYSIDDPRRLCKHIINKFDIENLPESMKYYKEHILYCQEREMPFRREFQEIMPLLDKKYIALYNDNDWTNIYNEEGEEFALIITSFNDCFKWAKDKKPEDFQAIEIYFDKDEYLQAIGLFEDEKVTIIEKFKEIGEEVEFDGTPLVEVAQRQYYSLLTKEYDQYNVDVTNETISFPYTTIEPIARDKEKVREALFKS